MDSVDRCIARTKELLVTNLWTLVRLRDGGYGSYGPDIAAARVVAQFSDGEIIDFLTDLKHHPRMQTLVLGMPDYQVDHVLSNPGVSYWEVVRTLIRDIVIDELFGDPDMELIVAAQNQWERNFS